VARRPIAHLKKMRAGSAKPSADTKKYDEGMSGFELDMTEIGGNGDRRDADFERY